MIEPRQQAFRFGAAPAPPPRRNLVIEAGAGTGKTSAIVAEVLSLLLGDENLSPERIVLMTFTQKAAGEISDRIHHALVELELQLEAGAARWPSDSPNPLFTVPDDKRDAYRRACARQIGRIDTLRSQTIHSFCQSLLRAFPIEAGLDPQFKIVEGFERTLLYGQLYDAWLDRETRHPATPDSLHDWELLLAHTPYLSRVRELLFSLLGRRDLLDEQDRDFGSISEIEDRIRRAIDLVRTADAGSLSDAAVIRLRRYFFGVDAGAATSIDDWISLLQPAAADIRTAKLPRTKAAADLKNALRILRAGDKGDSLYDALVAHRAASALLRLTRRFIVFSDEEKRKRGVTDFDDLLLRTLRLLDDESVLERIRKQFDFIFVDEFQDTDRTQARIIRRIATDASGSWVPGKLTIVGDPKQSIYGFRRADPETYRSMTQELAAAGAEERLLTAQYRSDPELLESINALFTRLLRSGAPDPNVFRPPYHPLKAARVALPSSHSRADPAEDARMTFLHAPSTDGRTGEAEAIAAWIGAHRDGSQRDLQRFALLFRRLTKVDDYLDTFDRYGIDYVLPQTRDFLDRRIPVDLTAVLRAIAWPFDRAALVSAARTPWFALTDDEIAEGILAGDAGEQPPEPWRSFSAALESFRQLSGHCTLSRLIDALVDSREVEAIYSLTSDGGRALRHLEHFRALAFEFDEKIGGSVREFVGEIDRRRDEADQVEPSLADDDSNAVRILSVHGAKGLEFDTVILPDLLFPRGGGEGVQIFTVDEPASLVMHGSIETLSARFRTTASGDELKKIASERDEAEMRRLFYVAVTRAAREVVFVCNTASFRDEGFFACLVDGFALDAASFAPLWPDAPGRILRRWSDGAGPKIAAFEKMAPGPAVNVRRSRLTDREIEEQLLNGDLAEAEIAQPLLGLQRLDATAAAIEHAAPSRRDAGTLLHRVLEQWDGRADLDDLVRAVSHETTCDEATREIVRKRLRTLRSSAMLQRIGGAQILAREIALRFIDERGEAMEKRADLLIREGGRDCVIDYKSGKPDRERLDNDSEQVSRYCKAVERMTGRPCSGALWYIDIDSDQVIEV